GFRHETLAGTISGARRCSTDAPGAAHRCIGDGTVVTVVERDRHDRSPDVLLVRSRAIQVTDVHRRLESRTEIGDDRLWRVHDNELRVRYAREVAAEYNTREARNWRGCQDR